MSMYYWLTFIVKEDVPCNVYNSPVGTFWFVEL